MFKTQKSIKRITRKLFIFFSVSTHFLTYRSQLLVQYTIIPCKKDKHFQTTSCSISVMCSRCCYDSVLKRQHTIQNKYTIFLQRLSIDLIPLEHQRYVRIMQMLPIIFLPFFYSSTSTLKINKSLYRYG